MEVSRPARLLLGLAALLLIPLSAAPRVGASEVCTPNATDPARFCVDYSLSVSSTTAAAPFDINASVSNTSPDFTADTNNWLNLAALGLTDASAANPPILTRSDQLADGLLLAGGSTCTAPTYTDCAGGNGTLVANVNAFGSSFNGQGGAFGIEKVVNVNPPGPGNYADYRATIRDCVAPSFASGACFEGGDTTQDIVIADPIGTSPPRFVFSLVTRGSANLGGGNGTADYSLSSFTLHLEGSTDQVDGGHALMQPQTVFALPRSCGSQAGSAAFVSGGARTISVPQAFQVDGCPVAAFGSSAESLTATFDGSGSSSPVAGRSVAKWHWGFGDGTPEVVTSSPAVTHDYANYGPKTVTLTVEDTAGALSAPATAQVDPEAVTEIPRKVATTSTVGGKTRRRKIAVVGTVAPSTATGQVSVKLLRRKRKGFVLVKVVPAPLTGGGFSAKFKDPRGACKCQVVATYGGDVDHEGGDAIDTFKC